MYNWKKDIDIDKVKNAILNNVSIASTLRELNLSLSGTNYKIIHFLITKYQLNTEHWLGQGALKGQTHNFSIKIPLEKILIENSDYLHTGNLKRRLIKEGLLIDQCNICSLKIWQGKKLIQRLDHINGKNTDNRIENLRLLCPNCDSQTETFCRGTRRKKENFCPTCNIKIARTSKNCGRCRIKNLPRIGKPLCIDCFKSISSKSTRCKSCVQKLKPRIKWPTSKELRTMISKSSYLQVGKLLGVSDNAIRHHLKHHP